MSPKIESKIVRTGIVDVHAESAASDDFRAIDSPFSALNLFVQNAEAASLRGHREAPAAIARPTRKALGPTSVRVIPPDEARSHVTPRTSSAYGELPEAARVPVLLRGPFMASLEERGLKEANV